jgi:hypothetical protein
MLNSPGTRCLLFGASGRIGGLCAELLTERRIPYGTLRRRGDLVFTGEHLGNLYRGVPAPGRYVVIDASIDYASLERMVAHEHAKLAFIRALDTRGELAGLLAFSSGVVEFEDDDITTEWHRRYKRLKLDLEAVARGLSCPAYCPRIFALIGPRSFRVTTLGWVDVIRQVCSGTSVGIGAPSEPRSWLAEDFLQAQLARFFETPGEQLRPTPVNGTFCLRDLAHFTARHLSRSIVIEPRAIGSWLSVPYVSRVPSVTADGCTLEKVLTPIVTAHMDSLKAMATCD